MTKTEYEEKISELEKQLATIRKENEIWREVVRELCSGTISFECPCPPSYYDARDEYGSDDSVWIQEPYCEGSGSVCVECKIKYIYKCIEERIKKREEY